MTNQTVRVGDNVTFRCPLMSDPDYYMAWYKSNPVGNATGGDDGQPQEVRSQVGLFLVHPLQAVTFMYCYAVVS